MGLTQVEKWTNPARLNSGFHNCKLFLQNFFKTSHAFLSTEYEIFQFQMLHKWFLKITLPNLAKHKSYAYLLTTNLQNLTSLKHPQQYNIEFGFEWPFSTWSQNCLPRITNVVKVSTDLKNLLSWKWSESVKYAFEKGKF